MTLLDLFALIGIASGGITIDIDVPLCLSEVEIVGDRGWFPERCKAGDNIPQGVLLARLASERDKVATGGVLTREETRQYAQVLLLLTFHELFESRGGNTAHLWWLPYLRYFDRMYDFDWGALFWRFYMMAWIRFRGI